MKTQTALKEKKKRKKIGGREWQWVQMSIFPVLHTFILYNLLCYTYGN